MVAVGATKLEGLRQPLEVRTVTLARAVGTLSFPSNFTLIAAMNPCPCCYHAGPASALSDHSALPEVIVNWGLIVILMTTEGRGCSKSTAEGSSLGIGNAVVHCTSVSKMARDQPPKPIRFDFPPSYEDLDLANFLRATSTDGCLRNLRAHGDLKPALFSLLRLAACLAPQARTNLVWRTASKQRPGQPVDVFPATLRSSAAQVAR